MIGKTDRGQGARRGWDDDTSTVLSTAVTSPEAEERGVKATSQFPATGSKPTGNRPVPAPSRPALLCLGPEVPTYIKKDQKVTVRHGKMTN